MVDRDVNRVSPPHPIVTLESAAPRRTLRRWVALAFVCLAVLVIVMVVSAAKSESAESPLMIALSFVDVTCSASAKV